MSEEIRNKQEIKVSLDKESRILFIRIGQNREGHMEELGHGVFARYDIDTDELLGFDIFYDRRRDNET